MKRTFLLAIYVFSCLLALAQNPDSLSHILRLGEVISNRKFIPETINDIRSMADGEHFTVLEGNCIIRSDYATGITIDTLFSPSMIPEPSMGFISDYAFDASETQLLLVTNKQLIYRRSFTATYFIFDLKLCTLTPLSNEHEVQLATFSPSGKQLAYVYQNNLYLTTPGAHSAKAVTTDGVPNQIINGAPDWVYEEEFEFNQAYTWSPDGRYLAWMRFDESLVKTYSFDVYDSVYPTRHTYKYPKAGETNSYVGIWVYDTQTGQSRMMNVGPNEDQYIPRIVWGRGEGQLCILRLNRLQNHFDALLADVHTGKTNIIYAETNTRFISGISDQSIRFLPDGFIVFSEKDGYRHLYHYGLDGKLKKQITKGDFDVDELLGVDTISGTLYYTSTESSPLNREIYRIHTDGTGKKKLSETVGVSTALFSHTFKYYIETWSDAHTPFRVTVNNSEGKAIRTLEDNLLLKNRITENGFVPKEFFNVKVEKDISLYGYLIKPPHFDSSKKYPVLMLVYGGPQSQEVTNAWDYRMGWQQLLAQKGYIVACVDNRGTDGRGEEFRKCIYKQLGKIETADQLAAARYLSQLPYVDAHRMGVFGWSYGGTMASLCMMKGDSLFRVGIAVAPVTDWRFYDSVYAERYMQTPKENADGYNSNSPLSEAAGLKGKFLLIHGSSDDNVHLQNSMELAAKLVSLNIPFDYFVYPNKNHSIYGGKTRLHIYGKITDFILDNL